MSETNVLKKSEEKIVVAPAEAVDPKEFFKDREGLLVFSSFEEKILEKAEKVEEGKEFSLDSFEIVKGGSDEEIEKELPENHVFSESEVASVVAELISKQAKGEDGVLLNNGYANLFYTPSCVVSVGWVAGIGEWSVGAWHRDGRRWGAEGRVFSPAADR